jgi:hypothetical protein
LEQEVEDEVFSERYVESGDILLNTFKIKLHEVNCTIPTAFSCFVEAKNGDQYCCIALWIVDMPNVTWSLVLDTETLKRLQEEIESPSPMKWQWYH